MFRIILIDGETLKATESSPFPFNMLALLTSLCLSWPVERSTLKKNLQSGFKCWGTIRSPFVELCSKPLDLFGFRGARLSSPLKWSSDISPGLPRGFCCGAGRLPLIFSPALPAALCFQRIWKRTLFCLDTEHPVFTQTQQKPTKSLRNRSGLKMRKVFGKGRRLLKDLLKPQREIQEFLKGTFRTKSDYKCQKYIHFIVLSEIQSDYAHFYKLTLCGGGGLQSLKAPAEKPQLI